MKNWKRSFFRNTASLLLLVTLLFAAASACAESEAVVNEKLIITEAQSNNDTDWNLGFHDYIEVYNAGDSSVMLSHYFLSRYEDDPFACRLPVKELEPGKYALLICDVDLLDFRLPKEGCELFLHHREGGLCDELELPAMENNVWQRENGLCSQPSPGYPNTAEGAAAYRASLSQTLRLSEVISSNSKLLPINDDFNDLIELVNVSEYTINLGDYYLSDKKSNPFLWQMPQTELAPGEFYVVQASGNSASDEAPFKVSATGETLYICDINGECIDALYIPALIPDTSYGRYQNELCYYDIPSIGQPNPEGYSGINIAPQASSDGK